MWMCRKCGSLGLLSSLDAGVGWVGRFLCVWMSPDGAREMQDDSSMKCMSCTRWSKVLFGLRLTNRNPSDLDNKFRVGVGEALKLILVQVHDEELVCGRQVHRHLCELLVEVCDITARFLPQRQEKEKKEKEKKMRRGKELEKIKLECICAALKRQVRKNKVNNKQKRRLSHSSTKMKHRRGKVGDTFINCRGGTKSM